MNKRCYRLIFNAVRHTWLAVAETVKSHISDSSRTKSSTASTGSATKSQATIHSSIALRTLTIKPLTFSLMLAPGMVGFIGDTQVSALFGINIAQAEPVGVIADPTAPANQRPIVGNATNGVPLVNI